MLLSITIYQDTVSVSMRFGNKKEVYGGTHLFYRAMHYQGYVQSTKPSK